MSEDAKVAVEETAKNNVGENANKEERKFSRDDINKAVAAEKAKSAAELEKKIEEITSKRLKDFEEAEKLKGLNELDKLKLLLEKSDAKVAEYAKRELINQYKVELTEKGLSSEFAELLPANNAETAKKAVDLLANFKFEVEKDYKEQISKLEEELRNASLRGTAPHAVNANINAANGVEAAFNKLNPNIKI